MLILSLKKTILLAGIEAGCGHVHSPGQYSRPKRFILSSAMRPILSSVVGIDSSLSVGGRLRGSQRTDAKNVTESLAFERRRECDLRPCECLRDWTPRFGAFGEVHEGLFVDIWNVCGQRQVDF